MKRKGVDAPVLARGGFERDRRRFGVEPGCTRQPVPSKRDMVVALVKDGGFESFAALYAAEDVEEIGPQVCVIDGIENLGKRHCLFSGRVRFNSSSSLADPELF